MAKGNGDNPETLAAMAASGDRDAYGRLVRLLMNRTIALTYRMTGDRQAAQDLAQEAFITAWQRLGQFRGESSFASWLYRIATNLTLNYLKSPAVARTTSLETVEAPQQNSDRSHDDPEHDLRRKELRRSILDFMRTLPDGQRAVFELRFYKQLSFPEISDTTGKALGTVKTHYRQAVIKLRQWARDKGWRQ